MICRSPAKINLYLSIKDKRADGYYNLESIVQLLDWYDTIRFEPAASLNFSMTNKQPRVPDNDSNLVVQAARLLAKYAKTKARTSIYLTKNIPAGSGLGGGSSNAAVTLLALNKLWDLELPRSVLAEIGSSLGADIPFFLGSTNALVQGKGEHLTRVSIESGCYILCLNDVFCSTGHIFARYGDKNWQLTTEHEWVGLPALGQARSFRPYDLVVLGNQLMPVVFEIYPQLESIYQAIGSVCTVTMSGSGSSFFALAANDSQARGLVNVLEQSHTGCRFVIVKGISHYDWYDVGV